MKDNTYKQINKVMGKEMARKAREHQEEKLSLAKTIVELCKQRRDLMAEVQRTHTVLGQVADHRNYLAGELADVVKERDEIDTARAHHFKMARVRDGEAMAARKEVRKLRRELDDVKALLWKTVEESEHRLKSVKHLQEELDYQRSQKDKGKDIEIATLRNYLQEAGGRRRELMAQVTKLTCLVEKLTREKADEHELAAEMLQAKNMTIQSYVHQVDWMQRALTEALEANEKEK